MIRHIEFCLQEIECEIEAEQTQSLTDTARLGLQQHIAGMRSLLAQWQALDDAMNAGDSLSLIRGIDQPTARLLAEKGVTRFDTIAAWRRKDILAIAGGGLTLDRIARENWIEQAAILATGQLTDYAKALKLASIATIDDLEIQLADAAVASPPEVEAPVTGEPHSPQIAAIAAALAEAGFSAPMSPSASQSAENIVALSPTRRTSTVRRVAHVAAALALMTTVGAFHNWKMPDLAAFSAAVSINSHTR